MEIQCPKCKSVLGKVAGKAIYLNDGCFISGQDFSAVIKCKCGEVATVSTENGAIKYDRPNTEPTSTNNGEGGNGNEPAPAPSDPNAQPGESGSTGKGEGGKEGEEPSPSPSPNLPPKPSWLKGK